MTVNIKRPVAVLVSLRFRMQRSAPLAFTRSAISRRCWVERARRQSLVTTSTSPSLMKSIAVSSCWRLPTADTCSLKSLRQAKTTPISIEKQSRDPRRLYEGNSPIVLTQDPKVDLEKKKITFPIVNAAVILATNKVYEFHDWKLACGGTQMYNMVNEGAAREFSYTGVR
jgi:hypothetical protein